MAEEPEDDPVIRTSISLRQSLWRDVEDYARRVGAATTAEAVRRLLSEALRAAAKADKK
jgi:hypothetical protein